VGFLENIVLGKRSLIRHYEFLVPIYTECNQAEPEGKPETYENHIFFA